MIGALLLLLFGKPQEPEPTEEDVMLYMGRRISKAQREKDEAMLYAGIAERVMLDVASRYGPEELVRARELLDLHMKLGSDRVKPRESHPNEANAHIKD